MIESEENKVRLFSVASKIIDTPKDISEKLVKAKKIENPNEDLLYLEFVLCHEGQNDNKDGFLLSELQENFGTVKFKDLNVEHSDKIVGCIYDGELIEDEAKSSYTFSCGFKPHIVCSAVVYQFKFPDIAQELRDRHSAGDLSFSMETWFKKAQCSECSEQFESVSSYCTHLNNRFVQGNSVIRWLRGLTFGGAGIVKNPADKDATSISVAVHPIHEFDVKMFVDAIGESLDNFEEVFEAWIKSLANNEVVDMSVVNTRVTEIVNNILTDDSSEANLSKGGQLKVAYTFDNKEDLVNSPEFKEAIQDTIDTRVTEALEKQDKEGVITEIKEKLQAQETVAKEFKDKVEKLEKDKVDVAEKAKTEKKDRELSELAETRFTELTEAGVEYAEDRIEKTKDRLKVMSDEDYAEYKEDVTANLPEKKDKDKKKIEAKIPLVPNKASAGIEESDYLKNIGVALTFNEPVFSDKELQN